MQATESDKARIIYSASFRRLQQKTQLFPWEGNASVRSRLTHTLEVAHIGRYLTQSIIDRLKQKLATENTSIKDLMELIDKLDAMRNIVENACFLHDIGNPPFGHLGEAAIRGWFKKYCKKDEILENVYKDFICFDGNPQGFRIATYHSAFDEYGLNLTMPLILSIIKYPWSHDGKPDNKKLGLFSSDIDTYQKACKELNWEEGKVFPFVLLMDAADDIANLMGNLEDAIEKGVIRLDDFGKKLDQSWMQYCKKHNMDCSDSEKVMDFKIQLTNKAVGLAAESFVSNLEAISSGNYKAGKLLKADNELSDLVKSIELLTSGIYESKRVEQIELFGNAVITGLLNHFGNLLDLSKEEFVFLLKDVFTKEEKQQINPFDLRLIHRVSKVHRNKYLNYLKAHPQSDERIVRAHLIVDFISGMTDDFAVETYQILQGMKI